LSKEYDREIIPLAKSLRKNATPEENKLWYQYLSSVKPRFQRQKCIDRFIADFYCAKAKLIIELDGVQHFTPEGKEKDEIRTEILERYNITILRIPNGEIKRNFEKVCLFIDVFLERFR